MANSDLVYTILGHGLAEDPEYPANATLWSPWQPTGTSALFWQLRAQRKYKEALAMLWERTKLNDAEAYFELAHIMDDGVLGYQRGTALHWQVLQRSLELHHPATIASAMCMESVMAADNLRYVEASGDLYARYRMAMRLYAGGSTRLQAACRELYDKAVAAGSPSPHLLHSVAQHFWWCSHEPAARCGHAYACMQYAYTTPIQPNGDLTNAALALDFLRVGAEQGHHECRKLLIERLFVPGGNPWSWREAAQNLVQMEPLDERRRRWSDRVFVSQLEGNTAAESESWTQGRLRELYVYATHEEQWDSMRDRVASLRDVGNQITRAARSATIVLFGIMHRRKRCPRDIALLVCKDVWLSRATRTITWWSPGIDKLARSSGFTTGYDYVMEEDQHLGYRRVLPKADLVLTLDHMYQDYLIADGVNRPRRGAAPQGVARRKKPAPPRLPGNDPR